MLGAFLSFTWFFVGSSFFVLRRHSEEELQLRVLRRGKCSSRRGLLPKKKVLPIRATAFQTLRRWYSTRRGRKMRSAWMDDDAAGEGTTNTQPSEQVEGGRNFSMANPWLKPSSGRGSRLVHTLL